MKRILDKIKYRTKLYCADKHFRRFIEHNNAIWRGWNNKDADATILFDFYGIAETEIARSYFLNILAKKHQAKIKSFGPHSIWANPLLNRIYKSFNVQEHLVTSFNQEQKNRMKAISDQVMKEIKTKQDVFNLKVLGIWLGIDIYESYLMTCHKPTVNLDAPAFIKMVQKGISLVLFWQDYFARNKIAAVVVSHDVYLDMNVVCKVAYQKKIPVYLPNVRGISLADKPFSVYAHLKNYRKMFKNLSKEKQFAGIALARRQMERRFSGEVGIDMPYQIKSGYTPVVSEKQVLKRSDRIKVLICSHCFFDNPHAYGEILFLDFYEWLHYLGKISEKTDYDWYLKMHPDPMPGTEEVIKKILLNYPRIQFIPPETSHHQLVAEGINFVLTVYGTVGQEYPALGVQVINAGYNPHIAYNFCWHPKSLEEYEYYLLNLTTLHKSVDLNELYEFYYLRYYYTMADDLVFKSYRQYLSDLTAEQRAGSEVYSYFLDQLTDSRHQEIIRNMQNFIDSGKHNYFSHGAQD